MKKIILAIAVAAIATVAFVGSASASVARYQVATGLTVNALNGAYVHTYDLNTNCSGQFTGTGGIKSLGLDETIHGTLDGSGNIAIHSDYQSYNTPFSFDYSGPLTGGGTYNDSLGQTIPVTFTVTMSDYKNHGDYVSSQGGGSDAAHSCIGMPVH